MLTRRSFALSLPAFVGVASVVHAKCAVSPTDNAHTVLMLNADCTDDSVVNVFEPAILHVNPGDSVTFVPTDKGHNAASKRGMIPEGATPWNSAVDVPLTLTLTVPGIYGYVCLPHYEMGMVGLIVVGNDMSNLKAVKKARHPGDARKAFRTLLAQLET